MPPSGGWHNGYARCPTSQCPRTPPNSREAIQTTQVRRFPTPTARSYFSAGTPDESGVDTTPEDVARTITTMRALGFAIAIDVANIADDFRRPGGEGA